MRTALAGFLSLAAAVAAEEPTFAGRNELVDQWTQELARLRAARKVQPVPGHLHSEMVGWDRAFDVGGARLEDGRRLQLAASPDLLAVAGKWPEGKLLLLCYDEARGATLLDPEKEVRLSVRHITDRHPIDDYLRSLRATYSTVEHLAVNEEAQRLWRLEIDRSVREVLAMPHLPPDVRADFIRLSKVRLDYIRLQSRFAAAAIHATYPGGTIRGPASGDASQSLHRAAYLELSSHHESYRSFAEPPAGK
jgi:hypothetical protein